MICISKWIQATLALGLLLSVTQFARADEAKGTIKEKVGQVTDNPNLTVDGQKEKFAGLVQEKVGQIEKVFEK